MPQEKYYYDTKSLSYKRIERSPKSIATKVLFFLGASTMSGIILAILYLGLVDSPKEKMLLRELGQMQVSYQLLDQQMDELAIVLKDLQERDDNIYRVIFETDPIPSTIRYAGLKGSERYKKLQNFSNSELMQEAQKKLDYVAKALYVQSTSYDQIVNLAQNKTDMLAAIPAIQPVDNKNLKRMASGYGYRIHPIYKTRKMHEGMDFTAPTGTPIYATGDGKVKLVKYSRKGFGRHVVINHSYGYETLYAHMNKYIVRRGQKVKRGDIIGYVGSTGTSTAPHLHYEVKKNGRKVNPVYYYFHDLSPEAYQKILEMAENSNQSFD